MSKHHPHRPVERQPEHPKSEIAEERIALLAYRYWEERGCPLGSPEEDWQRAEAELRRQQELALRL